MKVKREIARKIPNGTTQISVCLPTDLLEQLDNRLDKKHGDLHPVFRSRPAVITAALYQFLTNGTTITLSGSGGVATDQPINA